MSSQSSIDHSPLTARQAEAGGYAWYSAQLYFHLSADRQDPQAPYPSTHAKGEQMKQLSVTLAKAPPNRALRTDEQRAAPAGVGSPAGLHAAELQSTSPPVGAP